MHRTGLVGMGEPGAMGVSSSVIMGRWGTRATENLVSSAWLGLSAFAFKP